MQTKVSVIIPVYNAEDFIGECVESILNQTLKEIEVILVDDESSDRSPEILAGFASKDNRVKVIRQKNQGAGGARNNGMKHATGEYLSILDADDFFEPDMLEKAYTKAKENDLDMIVFACDLYDDKEKTYRSAAYAIKNNLIPEQQPFRAVDVRKDVFKIFVGWAWDKLFRREFVEEHNLQFQVQRTTNDMLFVFSALLKSESIMTMPDILAHHRRGSGSLSVTREKSWMCFYNALTALRAQMKAWGIYERFEQDFINYCVHFSLWNLNSLAEPTHTILYNKLREEWFDELGVTAHEMEYFYNRHEYLEYRKVYEHPLNEVISKEEIKEINKKENRNIILRGWDCYKENGLKYTIKNILGKIFRK